MKDVPVLFAISGDPVELGIAQSLSRPGGNFTGSTFMSRDIAGKRVELFKELVPQIRKLAVLSNTDHPGERSEWRVTEEVSHTLGITPVYVPFAGAADIDRGLMAVRDARGDAMLVFPDGVTLVNRAKIAGFAMALGLPSMFGWREYCDAGGLMSYGANQRATHVRRPHGKGDWLSHLTDPPRPRRRGDRMRGFALSLGGNHEKGLFLPSVLKPL